MLVLGVTAAVTQARGQAVIRGQVRADSSRIAIPFAVVDLVDLRRTVQASISGVYSLTGVLPGRHRIVARAVGYQPLEVAVEAADGDTLSLDLLLARLAFQLAPLISAARVPVFESGKMAEFNRRRTRGPGRFLSRAALAAIEPAPLSFGLRQTTGVRLIPLPWPCVGEVAITGRDLGTGGGAPFLCGAQAIGGWCFLSVVLDGALIWELGNPRQPPDLSGISASELQAVEIYRGPSEIPIEFSATGSECGVIVLWTRTGEDPL